MVGGSGLHTGRENQLRFISSMSIRRSIKEAFCLFDGHVWQAAR